VTTAAQGRLFVRHLLKKPAGSEDSSFPGSFPRNVPCINVTYINERENKHHGNLGRRLTARLVRGGSHSKPMPLSPFKEELHETDRIRNRHEPAVFLSGARFFHPALSVPLIRLSNRQNIFFP
jgi:hypothetical protein